MKGRGRTVRKKVERRGSRFAARLAAAACALLLMLPFVFAQASDSKTERSAPASSSSTPAPKRDYPKEIRGYKLARAKVEIKKTSKNDDEKTANDTDALIQFGEPRVVKTTPLGITLEVPVTVAAVKQGGHVDFLTFEDVVVNGMPVTIEDYMNPFELPNKEAVSLPQPVRLFISSPRALAGAISDWRNPQETWPVTARVYVFGRFKKFIFTAKRVVPLELTLTLQNPLRTQKTEEKLSDPAIKQ
jgi:hypothetical protein